VNTVGELILKPSRNWLSADQSAAPELRATRYFADIAYAEYFRFKAEEPASGRLPESFSEWLMQRDAAMAMWTADRGKTELVPIDFERCREYWSALNVEKIGQIELDEYARAAAEAGGPPLLKPSGESCGE